jgi:hypothetical protein
MSRPSETVRARLTESPPALRAHALLVLAAAAIVGPGHGPIWFSIAVVALIQWALLGRALVAWWIEIAGLAMALFGLWRAWGFVDDAAELSAFVSTTTIAVVAVLVLAAWVLLLTPAVRTYCGTSARRSSGAFALALAAVFVGPFPAMALSVEPRLPSRSSVLERTPDVVHVGTDQKAPSVFYVGGHSREVCMVVLEPRSSSRSCYSRRMDLEHVDGIRTEHVQAWALPVSAVRVDVVYDDGTRRQAEALYRSGAVAGVFYTTVGLDDVLGIEAYDASGDRILKCRFCELAVEVDP